MVEDKSCTPSARVLTEEGSLVCRDDWAFPHSELHKIAKQINTIISQSLSHLYTHPTP